jgi:2-keto-4-pentenoate hydratase/2-oxohepta-3-ene-1,7-dioic acid hydratase in catechol pathway
MAAASASAAARSAAAAVRSGAYTGTKIVAVAKNYAKHKVEMGGTPARLERPAVFLKPNSSVIAPGQSIIKPRLVKELHHEVELGVVIGARAKRVAAADWRRYVSGYVLGLDMTARDLQAEAKRDGMPWTLGKCWDTFAALSSTIDAAAVPDPHALELYLYVDGQPRQRGSTGEMLHKIPELLEFISSVMTLEPGDVILTGTPDGIGAVEPGQVIKAGITGLVEVSFPVEAER